MSNIAVAEKVILGSTFTHTQTHTHTHTLTHSHTVNLGTLATMAAHAMLGFLPGATYIPFIAMVLMGLAYSLLACALWPMVAFIVPEYQLGTAYGM